ncbi:uncharacterized protein RCC_07572 [Ramularia collo-cygni]|uniref:BNS1 protein n=1 Tax=Ramularia collo-cygni TaxID=112498 RepID=A0A2D3VA97_9PEZI|nr:uncharacterized protein RCC_07572 [Ramularia collo-cygni]CZT21707.1 uncharacterized protein RCC_07572 [Ramularia collo-cygni]
MSHSIASALAEKDSNQQPIVTDNNNNPSTTMQPGEENKTTHNTDEQKQALDKKIAEHNNSSGTYISPSDAILSPASSKLAGFKQRQINKQTNNKNPTARSLFSRTMSGNSGNGLEDSEDAAPAK